MIGPVAITAVAIFNDCVGIDPGLIFDPASEFFKAAACVMIRYK